MSQIDERQRSIDAKLARIRARAKLAETIPQLQAVIAALIDLLGDEL